MRVVVRLGLAVLPPVTLVSAVLVYGSIHAQEPAPPAEAPAPTDDEKKVGDLGRVGPPGKQTLMLGVDAPGFSALSPKERALLYYLNRAAIAGDAIFTQQSHRHGQDLITLLNEIDLKNDVLEPATAAAVREELVRLFIHHGPYDHWDHVKHERWSLTPTMLAEAAVAAERAGAKLPKLKGESTEQMLQRLTPTLLDPDFEPVHVEQGKDKDIIAESATNIYARGITQKMIEGLLPFWQDKINVRFDLQDGKLMLQEYRIGGLYSQELWTVSYWLKKALPLAQSKEQADSIHALIDFYATGDEGLFREHSRHWLKSDTRVDYVNGFVETYMDPRGVVGSWEATVSYQSDSDLVRKLAQNAQYFEGKMPWDKKWQRQKVEVPVATVVNVVMETGDAGPISAAAYNLPNYLDIRRDYGSKNVVLLNVELARSEDLRRAVINEFYPEEDRQNAIDHGIDSRRWIIYMHEVIGHGSGQPDPSLKGEQKGMAGRTAAALEECRADVVALYQVLDPKLIEIGAFKSKDEQEKVARDMYVSYLTNDMVLLRTDAGTELREAHRRGYHLVTEFLLDGGGTRKDYGVKRVVKDGKTFISVGETKKVRQGVADLLAILQRYKSLNDDKGATELFDKYGTRIDPKLKEEIVARAAPLNLPKARAFVFPRLIPVVQGGEVVDARIARDEDLLAQHRRFLRIAKETQPESGR
ncbi:MAG: hypothetical protein AB2A00_38000 [Myxococcota bacterium]